MFLPKIGLALGGGGARGGAHIGVLRVLEEIGYKPDIVVGTSIGGIVATMVGMGWLPQHMTELLAAVDFDELIKIDRTGRGLLSVGPLKEILAAHFADIDLRDLSPKIAVVAADIVSGDRILIERGPVVDALLATTALPGIFPSVTWSHRKLVDGGVVSNVPTQAAYQLGAKYLVAVDLGNDLDVKLVMNDIASFNKQLQRALYWLLNLSRREEVFNTLLYSTMLSQQMLTAYEMNVYPPDVLIRAGTQQVGLLDLKHAIDLVSVGECAARQHLHDLQILLKRANKPLRRLRYRMYRLPPLVSP
nr:patatin-like phospholipase family protein [Anaerolineae bacterium]